MSDIKFTDLPVKNSIAANDLIPIVDASNPLMSQDGSNAIISVGDFNSSFFAGLADGSINSIKIQPNPTFTGTVTLPYDTNIGSIIPEEIQHLSGLRDNIQYQLDNPTLPGTLNLIAGTTQTAPLKIQPGQILDTPVTGCIEFNGTNLYFTNNTPGPTRQIVATKSYVDSSITSIVGAAPDLLNTLDELAAALADDANYAASITTALSLKAPAANPTFSGAVTFAAGATITLPSSAVTSDSILDGTIANVDISTSAAIAGSKIVPNFASQNVITNGSLIVGDNSTFTSRIGIDDVTPQTQIIAGGNNSAGALFGRFSADAASSRLSFVKSRNTTKGSHTIVNAADDLGLIVFGGSDGVKIVESARIHADVDVGNIVNISSLVSTKRYRIVSVGTANTAQWTSVGWVAPTVGASPAAGDFFTASVTPVSGTTATASEEPNLNDVPGRLVFGTTAKGAVTTTERLRINSSGEIIVGGGGSTAIKSFETRMATTAFIPNAQILSNTAGGTTLNKSSSAIIARFSADAEGPKQFFAKSYGTTTGSHAAAETGSSLGVLSFGGSDGTKIVESARIEVGVEDGQTINSTNLVANRRYKISTVGTSVNWTTVGATTGTLNEIFVASGPTNAGTGGQAIQQPYTDNVPGRISFYTTPVNSQTPAEAMRINRTGGVSIGSTAISTSAILHLESTTKGFRLPVISDRTAISGPTAGLMIYNSATNKLNFYNGTAWQEVTSTTAP